MIVGLLLSYRSYLETIYSKETARVYHNRLAKLFEGQSLTDTLNKLDMEKILENLALIKHKNPFSQSKNALLHFCEFQNISLSQDVIDKIEQLEKSTRKKYRKRNPIDFEFIDKRIKHIKNQKLKLCYETMRATGIRVSEMSGIARLGCSVCAEFITFSFIAKGGTMESVTVSQEENPSLYEKLKEHIKNTPPDKNPFYSAIYLQTKAKELGFMCHDLRRIFARLEYNKCGSKETVMENLRHSNARTTDIYLKSKIIFSEKSKKSGKAKKPKKRG